MVRGRGGYRRPASDQPFCSIPAGVRTTVASDSKPLTFLTNYVKINYDNTGRDKYLLYRVDFAPTVESDDIRTRLVKRCTTTLFNGNYTYDRGNDLKSAVVLPNELTTVQAKHPADDSVIILTIKKTNNAINNFDYIRMFNMQMNEFLREMGYFKMRDSYFHHDLSTRLSQTYRINLVGGYNTTTSYLKAGIMMNLDSKTKIIQDVTLLQMIDVIYDTHRDNVQERVRNELTGKVVITKYNNRTYKIEDVDFDMTPQNRFTMRGGGGEETYTNYYKRQYNLTVRNTTQPLLRAKVENVARRRREMEMAGDSGTTDTPIMLLPEFCYMTGLSEEQNKDTRLKLLRIQASQVPPTNKVASLRQFVQKMHDTPLVRTRCQAWKYNYARDLAEVKGRQLEQVEILTGRQPDKDFRPKRTKCQNAGFDMALRGAELYEVPKLRRITLIMGRGRYDPPAFFDTIKDSLTRSMVSLGLALSGEQLNIVGLHDTHIRSYLSACRELRPDTTIVLCLLPDQSKDRYDAIKKYLSVERGIPSQCFLAKHFRNEGPRVVSVCNKIAIQIASKIGGVPWSLQIPTSSKYMICGYDAWHDSLTKTRSWGAFCSSLNSNFTKWWSKADNHDQLEELSTNLANNVFEGVKKFYDVNKQLPDKIFIYRDGVGQGDFDHVYDIEIKRIKDKLIQWEKEREKKIQLAVIIVTKRIGARFFLKKQSNQFDNPPPGTVIDSDVTRKNHYDFYLVSHSTRNGTISPTMYDVIEDDTGIQASSMQTLSYKLCHLYFNWSGAVRVPAPCQYAHKLAYLMGESLHCMPHVNLDNYLHYL